MINEELYRVVKEICNELIAGFETDGVDLSADSFLSHFSYIFLTHEQPERKKRVLDAALSPTHKDAARTTIEAVHSNHADGDFEFYVVHAVEDFLNYIIPRIAGLPDRDAVFDHYYGQFDQSFYGETCLVTTFAILRNVWDHGLRAVMPPGFLLRYYSKMPKERTPDRYTRDRAIPYFEISRSAHPRAMGRSIENEPAYFVVSYSTALPKAKKMIPQAYALRDEITRKFIFAIRLLKFSAAFADYRGFRTIGQLHQLNLMNFPDEALQGDARELSEFDGYRLGRLLPKLVAQPYDFIAVLDTKIEDALRRNRYGGFNNALRARLAVDQLLDYFQILEAVVPVGGSEYIALYSAVLLHAVNRNEDAESTYEFVKRMYGIRNDVMHGRIQSVVEKGKLTTDDIPKFREIIHALAEAYVMNGSLRDQARLLALGKPISLISSVPGIAEEMNAMRRPQAHPPTW